MYLANVMYICMCMQPSCGDMLYISKMTIGRRKTATSIFHQIDFGLDIGFWGFPDALPTAKLMAAAH